MQIRAGHFENGALVRATCAKQPKMAKLPRNALAQTRMKNRTLEVAKKETCEVNREMACGYCGSKTMHFGQNVMYKDATKRSVM